MARSTTDRNLRHLRGASSTVDVCAGNTPHLCATNLYLKVRRKQDLQPVDTLCFTTAGIDLNIRCVPVRQVLVTSLPILHQCGLRPGDLRENIVVDFANLHDLPSGTILRIGDALIRLTFHCEPCKPVLKYVLLEDILHKRGVLGQFMNRGQVRIGDRLIVARACAESIPYDTKQRIRWYMAPRRCRPQMACLVCRHSRSCCRRCPKPDVSVQRRPCGYHIAV
jgi:MOSC domain-containing protein